jgi:hypothetical protein
LPAAVPATNRVLFEVPENELEFTIVKTPALPIRIASELIETLEDELLITEATAFDRWKAVELPMNIVVVLTTELPTVTLFETVSVVIARLTIVAFEVFA